MLIGSTQILGPIPARSLDPILLVQSQPPEMRGYVVLSSRERTESLNSTGERTWDAIFLAGNSEPDCLRLTETARTLVPFARIRLELQNAGKEGQAVHLFEAPERLLREFLWTAHADPVLKVTLDSLDLRQIEALLAGSPVRKGLLERSDCTGDLPRFELARISTFIDELGIPFTLPQLQLGYEKGGMALYHCDSIIERPAPMRIIDSVLTGRDHKEDRPTVESAQTPAQPQKTGRGAAGKRRSSDPVDSLSGTSRISE